MSKSHLKYTLKIILIACFGIFLFMFFTLVRNTIHPRRPIYSTPEEFAMKYEDVEFKTKDGFNIKGWLILNNKLRPTIVVCHGFGTTRSDMLVLAEFIFKSGYNILLFDFRGHGQSQGWYTSFGYLEKRDLEAAIEFLKNSQDIKNKNFAVIGVSMGASIAIMTAAENRQLRVVVADSSYADLDNSIIQHTKFLLKTPFSGFLGRLAILSYRLRFFTDSSKVSPLKEISRISPRAVMIISGSRDKRIPLENAKALYLNARQPKELFLTPSAGHSESYWQSREEYQTRVISFFHKYLPLESVE